MSGHCRMPVSDRFMVVRQQLDELGYKQSLAIDCLPLVEQLLADLVHTTESLRRYKDLAQQALEKCNLLERGSQPYISENARLVRDCNDLHNKLLRVTEELQESEKDHKKQIKIYETEKSESKFLESQLRSRIEELQLESAAKTKKLLEEKKFDALITVPAGGRKRSFTFRRPRMEMDAAVTSARSSRPSARGDQGSPPPPLDVLRVVEEQAASLAQELKAVRDQKRLQTELCASLKQQVASRDQEIARLQKMLEGGIPVATVVREQELEALSEQQAKVKSLEVKVKEATDKQHEAMANAVRLAKRNERLEREMKDMDKLACAINSEKTALTKKVVKTEEELRISITRNQELEDENKRFKDQGGSGLENCNKEKKHLQKRLDAAQAELKSMKSRERELMLELQRVARGPNGGSGRPRAPRSGSARSRRPEAPRSGSSGDERQTEPKQLEDPWLGGQHNGAPQQQQQALEIQRLQSERDQLSSDCQRLREEVSRLTAAAARTVDNGELRTQLGELSKELTASQQANRNLSREIASLNAQLLANRDAVTSSNTRDTRAATAQLETERDSARSELRRLQAESQGARDQLRRLQEERDSLQEQLRVALSAGSEAPPRPPSGEGRVLQLESERQGLLTEQASQRGAVASLEQQLRTSEAELTRQRTQYLQLKSLHEQTEASLAGLQAEMANIQRDLATAQARISELSALKTELMALKEERAKLRANAGQGSQERDALMLQVDEKSERIATLQSELRAKENWISNAERTVADLKKQLEGKRPGKSRRTITAEILTTLTLPGTKPGAPNPPPPAPARPERWIRNATTSPPRTTQDAGLARQQDAKSLQREVERLRQELEKTVALRDASQREIKRLQDDLAASLQDCRHAQRDLALSQREAEDLKQKLQDYVAEVERVEQLLAQKEEDRNDLLEHFRSLSAEATELETHNHSLKSETSEVKRTLQATEGQVAHLEDQLATSKALIFGYENQIVELTQHVGGLESQMQQLRERSAGLEKDLGAVRDLCMKLDSQKEALQDDLADSRRKCTELEASSARMREELAGLQAQLHHEQGTKGALESVLERSREESLQQRLSNEELTQQMGVLRSQVSKLEHKQEQSELGQRQAAECSRQVEELRRQVAHEKFERARVSEESRRYIVQTRVVASSTFPPSSSGTPSEESTPRGSEHPASTSTHVTLTTNVVTNSGTSKPTSTNLAWTLPTSKSAVSVAVHQEEASGSPSLSLQSLSPDSSD